MFCSLGDSVTNLPVPEQYMGVQIEVMAAKSIARRGRIAFIDF